MPHFAIRRTSVRAFTLVELLSVVAIIGVLASLIIVSVGAARKKAADATCQNHLRQLATAYLMFVADNKGFSIPANVSSTSPWSEGGHSNSGIEILRRYYREGPRYSWAADHSKIQEPMERCPTALMNEWTNVGYGLSDHMSNRKIIGFYQMPAKTPMLWDGSGNWISGAGRTMPLRHNGGLHAAFLDGHVEYIPGTDGRLYSSWWGSAVNQANPNNNSLGQGTYLGAAPDA